LTTEQVERMNRMAKQLTEAGLQMHQAGKRMQDALEKLGLTLAASRERMQRNEEREPDG
jgi:hypothetical protein